MFAHISLGTSALSPAVTFYEAALAPIGWVLVWRTAQAAGYGEAGGNDRLALFESSDARPPAPGFHLAFQAPTRAAVDAFHAAALAAGGTDNGQPGLRIRYSPTYYAAFVIDPDGHHLEAVCQTVPTDAEG